jgi:hypothetical protein
VPLCDEIFVNPLGNVGMMIDVTGNISFPEIESSAAGIYTVDAVHSGESVPE